MAKRARNGLSKARLFRRRPVIGKIDGEEVVFDSAQTASREMGVPASSITACCRGRQKTAGGFRWEYYGEPMG